MFSVAPDLVESEESVRWKSKVCRRAVVDHTFFFATAEQDELKTLLRNFALYTAVNLKAEVHTAELLRINLDEMWSDKFPIGIPIQIKGCAICHGKPYPSIRRISGVSWSCAGSNPGCAE